MWYKDARVCVAIWPFFNFTLFDVGTEGGVNFALHDNCLFFNIASDEEGSDTASPRAAAPSDNPATQFAKPGCRDKSL